ncbi:hypothetical protein G8A07_24570 [Roseateles sp. DAIF2]|uniref:alpha/beta hydrolase family protein n=1 Tax=Roseateles sp. DAIF2 TaxID=2714952 RepID=UPI0018A25458|nr:hypothetical protein [Roseateles sp. DAIF2]QPF75777.1 hypothetical protein G8A07_24570 [Roseateles sp. DAIF2]
MSMPAVASRPCNSFTVPRLLGLAALLAGLAGCGGGDDERPYARRCGLPTTEASRLPAPTGGSCVGKAGFLALDGARLDPYAGNGSPRELSLKVWYPIHSTPRAARADYMDAQVWSVVRQAVPALPAAQAPTNARKEASLNQGRRHPVLLFSPGWGAPVEVYSSLLEDMASHGYVVVAINHPYLSGPTLLSGGRLVVNNGVAQPSDASMATMVADQRFVLDWLKARDAEPAGHHLLAGRLDLSRVGAYGHSFGGSAALQTSRQDARVQAGIDIDGSVYGERKQPWTKPLMFLLSEDSGANGGTVPSIEEVWKLRQGPGKREVLAGSKHNGFADIKFLLGSQLAQAPEDLRREFGRIDAQQALRWTREQTRDFMGSHLRR